MQAVIIPFYLKLSQKREAYSLLIYRYNTSGQTELQHISSKYYVIFLYIVFVFVYY